MCSTRQRGSGDGFYYMEFSKLRRRFQRNRKWPSPGEQYIGHGLGRIVRQIEGFLRTVRGRSDEWCHWTEDGCDVLLRLRYYLETALGNLESQSDSITKKSSNGKRTRYNTDDTTSPGSRRDRLQFGF